MASNRFLPVLPLLQTHRNTQLNDSQKADKQTNIFTDEQMKRRTDDLLANFWIIVCIGLSQIQSNLRCKKIEKKDKIKEEMVKTEKKEIK